ncbi:SDR family NAD(P)-dependent oxidoreductase [Rubellimicrobium aerolatum]|uniref:SDR family NAD(P)-dependent oxidoreductase n=1 Tax=Rubellimicrobium aerolatum TaxID=490979 RepID=A0ABW0SFD3_9RHOB|nr:SDR family NAD(P)-dependent oxidoreductase [Rubellimicrobium aerolatum]MBP1807047.1 3-oxoacyl-[acyl-carrier protein] reductase [Rubellimicrobium aerolatum]
MNHYDLQGRVAVVTGGAQGIGLAVARRMVASGATVALWDRDEVLAQGAARDLGPAARAYGLDVTDGEGVIAAAARTRADLGPIAILVTSAGIAGSNAKVVDTDPAEWDRILDVNLTGTFHCCRAVLPQMVETGYGRVVTIASIAGKEGNPSAGAYSASKGGVIALTKSLGKEHAAQDIAVNCVTPATAKTRILDTLTPQFIDYMLSRIPRARFLELEEAASLVTWLCTAENSFTTGAVFDLSGGRATY